MGVQSERYILQRHAIYQDLMEIDRLRITAAFSLKLQTRSLRLSWLVNFSYHEKSRHSTNRTASTPSLLNGSGKGKAVLTEQGMKISIDITSPWSPLHSRSSSAQESYSTSATIFEDTEEKMGPDEVHIDKWRQSGPIY